MLSEIFFTCVEGLRAIPRSPGTAVISILDISEAHSRPDLSGFGAVLSLSFEDTYEHGQQGIAPWPDSPSDEEHARYCQGPGERVPALEDAHAIVAFIRAQHGRPEPIKLVVHCYGGISRSAAVASWAASTYWVPLSTTRSTDRANPRLLRLLDKAAGRR